MFHIMQFEQLGPKTFLYLQVATFHIQVQNTNVIGLF